MHIIRWLIRDYQIFSLLLLFSNFSLLLLFSESLPLRERDHYGFPGLPSTGFVFIIFLIKPFLNFFSGRSLFLLKFLVRIFVLLEVPSEILCYFSLFCCLNLNLLQIWLSSDLNLFQIWVHVNRSYHLCWSLQLLINKSDNCNIHRVGCSDLFNEKMILKLMTLFRYVLNLSGLLYLLNYRSKILVLVFICHQGSDVYQSCWTISSNPLIKYILLLKDIYSNILDLILIN